MSVSPSHRWSRRPLIKPGLCQCHKNRCASYLFSKCALYTRSHASAGVRVSFRSSALICFSETGMQDLQNQYFAPGNNKVCIQRISRGKLYHLSLVFQGSFPTKTQSAIRNKMCCYILIFTYKSGNPLFRAFVLSLLKTHAAMSAHAGFWRSAGKCPEAFPVWACPYLPCILPPGNFPKSPQLKKHRDPMDRGAFSFFRPLDLTCARVR